MTTPEGVCQVYECGRPAHPDYRKDGGRWCDWHRPGGGFIRLLAKNLPDYST